MRSNTPYLSGFSPNAAKYEPEKLRILTLLTGSTPLQLHLDPGELAAKCREAASGEC